MKLKRLLIEIQSKFGYHHLIPILESLLKINVSSYLDSGGSSDTFILSNNKVLKITCDENEASGLYEGFNNTKKLPILRVFYLYKILIDTIPEEIKNNFPKKRKKYVFVAITEFLDTESITYEDLKKLIYYMIDLKIFWDASLGNIGKNKTGNVVILDPDFGNSDNISKIPSLTL